MKITKTKHRSNREVVTRHLQTAISVAFCNLVILLNFVKIKYNYAFIQFCSDCVELRINLLFIVMFIFKLIIHKVCIDSGHLKTSIFLFLVYADIVTKSLFYTSALLMPICLIMFTIIRTYAFVLQSDVPNVEF